MRWLCPNFRETEKIQSLIINIECEKSYVPPSSDFVLADKRLLEKGWKISQTVEA
jgi:hypothetical protein